MEDNNLKRLVIFTSFTFLCIATIGAYIIFSKLRLGAVNKLKNYLEDSLKIEGRTSAVLAVFHVPLIWTNFNTTPEINYTNLDALLTLLISLIKIHRVIERLYDLRISGKLHGEIGIKNKGSLYRIIYQLTHLITGFLAVVLLIVSSEILAKFQQGILSNLGMDDAHLGTNILLLFISIITTMELFPYAKLCFQRVQTTIAQVHDSDDESLNAIVNNEHEEQLHFSPDDAGKKSAN